MRIRRRGVALLALAFLVAGLLATWGMQQSWQSQTAKRRIREANLDAALLVQTDSCLDGAEAWIRAVGNDGEEDPAELGTALRSLQMGSQIELAFEPPYLYNRIQGITIAVESSKARAVLLSDEPAAIEREPDCKAFAEQLAAYGDRTDLPPGLAGLIPGSGPSRRALGLLEIEVVSRADGLGLVRRMTGRSRRAFELVVPPCSEVLGPVLGLRFASLIELNPVELARRFDAHDTPEGTP